MDPSNNNTYNTTFDNKALVLQSLLTPFFNRNYSNNNNKSCQGKLKSPELSNVFLSFAQCWAAQGGFCTTQNKDVLSLSTGPFSFTDLILPDRCCSP